MTAATATAGIRDRVAALRYFRLVRGPGGGMADHPDALSVDLPAVTDADLRRIYAALAADMLPGRHSGTLVIEGVTVNTFRKPGVLELFITGEDNAYRITPAAVEAAHRVESRRNRY